MPTASNGNGHSGNGVIPISESGAPLVLGGLAIAGSPLDVAELERLANEMFRAGPEGAGLGPEMPDVPDVSGESVMLEPPAAPDLLNGAAVGDGVGIPAEPEMLQWTYLDGALRNTPMPGAPMPGLPGAPMPGLPGAPMPGVPAMPMPAVPAMPMPGVPAMPMPGADSRADSGAATPAGGADLFALHGDRLSLAELGLVETPRVSTGAADPAAGSYYFMDESRSFASSQTSGGGATSPASSGTARSAYPAFDVHAVRRDFPVLSEHVHGGLPLVWLDNAATTQKPQVVIDRVSYYYERENSNVHRGAHTLAARATDAFEAARDRVRRLLNAPSAKNIVWVRGATEGINLVAKSWGMRHVSAGDEIVITWLEHHANIVPWQQLCTEKGARLRVAPVDDRGQVKLEEYERLLGPRTRIVAFPQVSNALGTVLPAREMVEMAHRHGAVVLVDGAQAVSHMPVDVQSLDCDFYTFSGHKIFAPTGIGAVFGKTEALEAMPPWQGGGNMISDVTFEKTTYQPPPGRFEAGTGSIGDAVGLGAAIDYVMAIGLENIQRYEHELRLYAEGELGRVPGLTLIGTAAEKAGVMSFVLDGVRTEDVGGALDQEGIAVRSGHHCAQPILRRFGLESTVRASLAPYNTREDIDALVAALKRLQAGRPPR